jgi:hypothetical protein
MKSRNALIALLSAFGALGTPHAANAAERRFGFSHESTVQSASTAELEPATDVGAGRTLYYSRMNARLGAAFGLAKNLEGAFFWDMSAVTEDYQAPGATQPARLSTTDFRSTTGQLKYKLSDAVADALGSAVLVAASYGPFVAGVEGRLVLDKQFGSLLLAANLFGGDTGRLDRRSTFEGELGASVAAGYFLTPSLVPALEVRSETAFDSNIDSSLLYFGPSLALLRGKYWATLAVEPQITAFKGHTPGHALDLTRSERVQARLSFGFAL